MNWGLVTLIGMILALLIYMVVEKLTTNKYLNHTYSFENLTANQKLRPFFLFDMRPWGSLHEPIERPHAATLFSFGGPSTDLRHRSRWPMLPLQITERSTALVVEGSDNGVVCLSDFDSTAGTTTVFLWNPARNEVKELPRRGQDEGRATTVFRLGIVHDCNSDDLKVILVSTPLPRHLPKKAYLDNPLAMLFTEGTEGWLYSLKADSWERVPVPDLLEAVPADKIRLTNPKYKSSVVVKGRVHWGFLYTVSDHALWDIDTPTFGIVSFDWKTKGFMLMTPPQGGGDLVTPLLVDGIANLFGCLSLLCTSNCFRSVNVWVMKDYGVSDSWTKHASVDLAFPFDTVKFMHPFSLTTDGHVLVYCYSGLVWYDLNTMTPRCFTQDMTVGKLVAYYVPSNYPLLN